MILRRISLVSVSTFVIFNLLPAFAFLLEGILEHETHHLCNQVLKLDCATQYVTQDYEVTCGTDDVTYANFCFYAQSKCKHKTLMIQKIGPCNGVDSGIPASTTRASISVTPTEHAQLTTSAVQRVTTDDVIVRVFCLNAKSYGCPQLLDPVCGSDGIFYYNDCEFAKAVCDDRALVKQAIDNCKSVSKHAPTTVKQGMTS